MPLNAIALCYCVQIERSWNRCVVSSGSPIATVTRCSDSLKNSRPALIIGPNYSIATVIIIIIVIVVVIIIVIIIKQTEKKPITTKRWTFASPIPD